MQKSFLYSLPSVSVSEYNFTCLKPVNLVRTGGWQDGREAIPIHLQLALEACPAKPHSVTMQECFTLSQGNQPVLEHEYRATISVWLQPVIKAQT